MTLDSRSTKHGRISSSPKPVVIVFPGESPELADGQEKFTRHLDFWLDDGNLILLAGDTAFRVYQGLLTKKSPVFADMFTTGSADVTETFDGCPIVHLPDYLEDLGDFLQYLMPCSELRLHDGLPVSDFSKLHAAIHLAHKYQCPDVETRALTVLKRFHTAHFTDYAPFDATKSSMIRPPPDAAIAAVNLTHLMGTLSMLPLALYCACMLEGRMMDGYEWHDGSVEYLAAADLRLCINAQTELAEEMVFFMKTVFTREPSDECKVVEKCIRALDKILEDVEMIALGSCAVLRPCNEAIEVWAEDYGLCGVCKREMLEREVAERRKVWRLLPSIFGLSAEACGFTGRDGSSQS